MYSGNFGYEENFLVPTAIDGDVLYCDDILFIARIGTITAVRTMSTILLLACILKVESSGRSGFFLQGFILKP